ncbi:MAG: LPP20 family lipoprotein [Proteobacteria bacterium]|nr:LPP20 family lipoprotein [Pseudomonadota bacterium]MBU1582972.1 LPP20 family lipoprotein [Pseudomonadota bacterium]MBU2452509.1 LPP20 family lipoprotein [Pseudomonadota bacterium]MBU2631765.1 LPP20 family lipoprotein [Pseudomonadota bacterium]
MTRKQSWGKEILVKLVILTVTLLSGLLPAPGCSKRPGITPVADTHPEFPAARFLRAEGSGSTTIDARRQALAELSSVFESRVVSQTTSLAKSSLGPDNAELFEKKIESRINIISSVRLEGARIGKTWLDEATGDFHALAVLDRVDAGKTWNNDLESLDNRLRAEVTALETAEGRLPRMASLNRIMSLCLDRNIIESRLMVVDYPALSEQDLDLAKLTSELAVIQSKFRFYVDVKGEYGQTAGKILSQTLTRNGIFITPIKDKADAWITGQVEITPLNLDNTKISFVRATGDVQVIETGTHALFAEINETIRKGHLDRDEAIHKAVTAVSRQMSDRLAAALGLSEK